MQIYIKLPNEKYCHPFLRGSAAQEAFSRLIIFSPPLLNYWKETGTFTLFLLKIATL